MRKHDLISGLFFLFLGIGVCFMAYRLKLGSLREPGAGLIPFGVASLLGFMSLGLVLQGFIQMIRAQTEVQVVFQRIAWHRLAILVCALLAYGFALETLGFHLCTFLLMMLLLGVADLRGLLRTLAVSFLTVVCVYLIFEVWLGCPFPRGFFDI